MLKNNRCILHGQVFVMRSHGGLHYGATYMYTVDVLCTISKFLVINVKVVEESRFISAPLVCPHCLIPDWKSYKKVRNTVNNQKKQAKELFYNNLELSISDFQKNDRRKFWQVVRHFVNNENSSSAIPPLRSTLPSGKKQFHFSDEEKAECLNEYFSSISNVDDRNTTLSPFFVNLKIHFVKFLVLKTN